MSAALGPDPDWRDPAHYAPILVRGRPALAWELLRRDPAFRAAAITPRDSVADPVMRHRAAVWGLHFPP